MDLMTFRDLVLVGLPEVILVILIGLLLNYGRKFKKDKALVFKILFSAMVILTGLLIVRKTLLSLVLVNIFSMTMYTITYMYIFNIGKRKSLILGAMSMVILNFSEVIFFPISDMILNIGSDIFAHRTIVTLGTRIVQCTLLAIIWLFNINLGNLQILNAEWSLMKNKEKFNLLIIVLLLVLDVISNAIYTDIYILLKLNGIKPFIGINIFLIQNIIFAGIVFYILQRTKEFYVYKQYLERGELEIFLDIIEMADSEKLTIYEKIIEERRKIHEEEIFSNTRSDVDKYL